jgi:predicted SprT family Zn-dependent metalloprotease
VRALQLRLMLGGGRRDPILEEVARGGSSFERVVLTRNRRVMVSVGERGKVLRLHEAFVEAPPEVLHAVGTLLAPRRAARSRARSTIGAFIAAIATDPGARRQRRVPRADRPALARLQAEFDRINDLHFGGTLPRVPLYLSGRMRRRNGHFCADPLEIVISRKLCEHAEDGEAESTLRHEMIHLWQHHTGRRPGHGLEFRQWARRLDVHPRATREVAWNCKSEL